MTCCTCLCAVAALLPSLLLLLVLLLLLPLPTPFSHLFARSSAQLLDPPRCGCSIIFANPFGYVASNKFSSVLVLLLHLPCAPSTPAVLYKRRQSYFSCLHAVPHRISINYIAPSLSLPHTFHLSLCLYLSVPVSVTRSGAQQISGSAGMFCCLCCGFSEYILIVCHIFTKSFLLPRPAFGSSLPIYVYLLPLIVYSISVFQKRETICFLCA